MTWPTAIAPGRQDHSSCQVVTPDIMWAVEGVPIGKMLVKHSDIWGGGHWCSNIVISCGVNPVSYVWVKPRVDDLCQYLGFGANSNNHILLGTSSCSFFSAVNSDTIPQPDIIFQAIT